MVQSKEGFLLSDKLVSGFLSVELFTGLLGVFLEADQSGVGIASGEPTTGQSGKEMSLENFPVDQSWDGLLSGDGFLSEEGFLFTDGFSLGELLIGQSCRGKSLLNKSSDQSGVGRFPGLFMVDQPEMLPTEEADS